MPIVTVPLGDRSYPIYVEPCALARIGEVLEACDPAPSSVVVVTHPGLAAPYAETVCAGAREAGLPVALLTVAPGERRKTLRTAARLYDRLAALGADRRCVLVAVGGGVIGDLVGFVAATYLRGVRFVQAPTTLLAQVDASVGGKTGVDLAGGKNLVGAFKQPQAVLADVGALRTLPARQLRSGLAEVIKHGIIRANRYLAHVQSDLPALLRRDVDALQDAVAGSCRIKADVVAADETEQGLRAVLNFGHTVGHALETVTGYRRFTHGEAVSIGMVSAALVGEELGQATPLTTDAITAALGSARLPVALPTDIDPAQVVEALYRDKKTVAGRLTFVLVPEIGRSIVQPGVSAQVVVRALARHAGRQSAPRVPARGSGLAP